MSKQPLTGADPFQTEWLFEYRKEYGLNSKQCMTIYELLRGGMDSRDIYELLRVSKAALHPSRLRKLFVCCDQSHNYKRWFADYTFFVGLTKDVKFHADLYCGWCGLRLTSLPCGPCTANLDGRTITPANYTLRRTDAQITPSRPPQWGALLYADEAGNRETMPGYSSQLDPDREKKASLREAVAS